MGHAVWIFNARVLRSSFGFLVMCTPRQRHTSRSVGQEKWKEMGIAAEFSGVLCTMYWCTSFCIDARVYNRTSVPAYQYTVGTVPVLHCYTTSGGGGGGDDELLCVMMLYPAWLQCM